MTRKRNNKSFAALIATKEQFALYACMYFQKQAGLEHLLKVRPFRSGETALFVLSILVVLEV